MSIAFGGVRQRRIFELIKCVPLQPWDESEDACSEAFEAVIFGELSHPRYGLKQIGWGRGVLSN